MAMLSYDTLIYWTMLLCSPSQRFGSTMLSLAKIYCFVFTISDHLSGKMASSHGDIMALLGDGRNLTRKTRQTSKEDDRQALPVLTNASMD